MEKAQAFFITVLSSVLLVLVIALPWLGGFRESATYIDTYMLGVFLGVVLMVFWVATIYLWKN